MSFANRKISVNITTPDPIYPVLLHLNRQQLIDEIIISSDLDYDLRPERISVTLPGLVHQPWRLSFTAETIGKKVIIKPKNPPISVAPRDHSHNTPEAKQLCVTIDGQSFFYRINSAPDLALPHDLDNMIALGALVFPDDPPVANFVRMAWNRYGRNDERFGYPEYSPVRAAEIIYE